MEEELAVRRDVCHKVCYSSPRSTTRLCSVLNLRSARAEETVSSMEDHAADVITTTVQIKQMIKINNTINYE